MQNKTKLHTIGTVLLISIMFTGCAGYGTKPNNSTANSTPYSADGSNSGDTSSSTPSSKASTPSTSISTDSASSDTSSTVLRVENWEDFIGADEQPVTLEGATVDEDGRVTLDYCFVKLLPQIYDDTFKNPALINWDTMEFAPFDGDYTPEIKRLKTGDVLENGLKVKEAYRILSYEEVMDQITCEIRREWCDSFGMVSFEGEITLSGVLYCVPEDDYMVFGGELYFFPDTTGGAQLPAQSGITPSEYRVWENAYPDAKLAVRSGTIYYVGNIDKVDLDGILERGKAAEVTVKLGNIRIENSDINHGGRGGGCFAEIVSIEKINN